MVRLTCSSTWKRQPPSLREGRHYREDQVHGFLGYIGWWGCGCSWDGVSWRECLDGRRLRGKDGRRLVAGAVVFPVAW